VITFQLLVNGFTWKPFPCRGHIPAITVAVSAVASTGNSAFANAQVEHYMMWRYCSFLEEKIWQFSWSYSCFPWIIDSCLRFILLWMIKGWRRVAGTSERFRRLFWSKSHSRLTLCISLSIPLFNFVNIRYSYLLCFGYVLVSLDTYWFLFYIAATFSCNKT